LVLFKTIQNNTEKHKRKKIFGGGRVGRGKGLGGPGRGQGGLGRGIVGPGLSGLVQLHSA